MAKSTKYLDSNLVSQEHTHDILPSHYKILICCNCNLYFKDFIPGDDELKRFYNSLGDQEWNYQHIHPPESYLIDILKSLPDKSDVLDVGCNTGRLLKNETERLNCYGVEINKAAATVAEQAGIKIIAEKVHNENLGEEKFDLITLIDVFEHLNDPMPFLRQLVKALKPGGKLYIFTGRTDCLPSLICGSYNWYYKPAQHLIFLNSKFIRWYKRNNNGIRVSITSMRHFNSNLRARVYQISWLIAWRFFSPSSPYRIFAMKKLARMKEPFMVTAWKDHVFFTIEKDRL